MKTQIALFTLALVLQASNSAASQIHPLACDGRMGVWIESEILENYSNNPCSVIVNSSRGPVLKLDRVNIRCDGTARVQFGFARERFEGDTLVAGNYELNSQGKLSEIGSTNTLERVTSKRLETMLHTARLCLGKQ